MTARTDYAVRAVIEVARHYPDALKGRAIAESQQLPYRFLAATLTRLSSSGILDSRRGSGADGGYRLSRRPDAITLAEIVHAIEGRVSDLRTQHADNATNGLVVWDEVGLGVERTLAAITVADLMRSESEDADTDTASDAAPRDGASH